MFQSTPPARGATNWVSSSGAEGMRFNPRPPHGGRLPIILVPLGGNIVSIHAPRTGGDFVYYDNGITPVVSIHAPRTGGDYVLLYCLIAL